MVKMTAGVLSPAALFYAFGLGSGLSRIYFYRLCLPVSALPEKKLSGRQKNHQIDLAGWSLP
ncbi:MAG: hypothetical protein IH598_01295 [Bacteroidales bacterium]|nr:hypothetical protein [Bacteroidales bacterium]